MFILSREMKVSMYTKSTGRATHLSGISVSYDASGGGLSEHASH